MDPYAVLGLWPGASQEQIKRAYRRAVKRCHPDINDSPEAREDFLRVQMAYELLSGNPFYTASEVIQGEGWSASRENTSVDFSPKSVSAYRVKVARETQSVQSPFFRASEKAVKDEDVKAMMTKKYTIIAWYAQIVVFIMISVGSALEGIYLVDSGRVSEGLAMVGFGVLIIIILVVILSTSSGPHLLLGRWFNRP